MYTVSSEMASSLSHISPTSESECIDINSRISFAFRLLKQLLPSICNKQDGEKFPWRTAPVKSQTFAVKEQKSF